MKLGKVRLIRLGSILLVVGVAAIAWFAVLSPRLSTAANLQARATQMETTNLSLQNQYHQALDQAAKAPEAAARAQVLFATMPQTAELPTVLDQITKAATDAGIDPTAVTTLTTGIPAPIAGAGADPTGARTSGIQLASMEIGVAAEGTRKQVLTFLDNLQGLDRALLVLSTNDTQVAQDPGQPSGPMQETMQVGGSMFVLQSKLPDLVATVNDLIAQASGKAAGAQPSSPPAESQPATGQQ